MGDKLNIVIKTITNQAEHLLASDQFEPQLLTDLLSKLDPLIEDLISKAITEPEAREFLSQLNLWFEKTNKLILVQRIELISSLKELNTGRKASHNYDKNR